MPYRRGTGLLFDASREPVAAATAGITANDFSVSLALAARGRLASHLTASGAPRPLPVPVRSFVGSGVSTAVRADVAAGDFVVTMGAEGDGTVPVASAIDFSCLDPLGRRVYPIPYAHHVTMIDDPLTRRFLRTELRYGTSESAILLAKPRRELNAVGDAVEVMLEIRDAAGHGLLDQVAPHVDVTRPSNLAVAIDKSGVEPDARAYLTFAMPASVVELRVTIPGFPQSAQPPLVRLFPA